MKRNNITYDILIVNDDQLSLPVAVVETIEEGADFIGCTTSALYKNMKLYGVMKANNYILELVRRNENE